MFDDVLFICHRINTSDGLDNVASQYGIEMDIRDSPDGTMRVVHDPFGNGENLDSYLQHYHNELIIFNVKSERIELEILKLVEKYNIRNYFFLDSTLPMIYLLTHKMNNKNVAIRYSEIEPLSQVALFENKANWVWVDCFSQFMLNEMTFLRLKNMRFKVCIVSPELHNRPDDIELYKQIIIDNNIIPDAICCKSYNINRWTN